jgi:hypothetical protein
MTKPQLFTINKYLFEGDSPSKQADKGGDAHLRNRKIWPLNPIFTWTQEKGM